MRVRNVKKKKKKLPTFKNIPNENKVHAKRLGGLGLPSLAEAATFELQASKKMTGAQVDEILLQNTPHPVESVDKVHVAAVHAARNTAKQERRKSAKDKLEEMKQETWCGQAPT